MRVTWHYDRAFGGGLGDHKGVITKLDDWITIKGAASTLHTKLTMLDTIDLL